MAMTTMNQIAENPHLKNVFLSYLPLGLTDSIHHIHAVFALGDESAMHAVVAGAVFFPVSVLLVWFFVRTGKKILVAGILFVPILTTLYPGFYHGGWVHLMHVLSFLRVEGEATNIRTLLPSTDLNLWFYEISGVLEFVFAVVCAYYLYKYFSYKSASA